MNVCERLGVLIYYTNDLSISFAENFCRKPCRRYTASNFWNLICLAPSRDIVFMYKLWVYQNLYSIKVCSHVEKLSLADESTPKKLH